MTVDYFTLCNECLRQLQEPTVTEFSQLVSQRHEQIKSLVNRVNQDVLLQSNVNCRQEKNITITVPADTVQVSNTVGGEIQTIYDSTIKLFYDFEKDYKPFYEETRPETSYGLWGDYILFGKKDTERTLTVYYYTTSFATSSTGTAKTEMTLTNDTTIIPEELKIKILVNGVCAKIKPQIFEAQEWRREYENGRKELNSYGKAVEDRPQITTNFIF